MNTETKKAFAFENQEQFEAILNAHNIKIDLTFEQMSSPNPEIKTFYLQLSDSHNGKAFHGSLNAIRPEVKVVDFADLESEVIVNKPEGEYQMLFAEGGAEENDK